VLHDGVRPLRPSVKRSDEVRAVQLTFLWLREKRVDVHEAFRYVRATKRAETPFQSNGTDVVRCERNLGKLSAQRAREPERHPGKPFTDIAPVTSEKLVRSLTTEQHWNVITRELCDQPNSERPACTHRFLEHLDR
jgi:hypothetical protein